MSYNPFVENRILVQIENLPDSNQKTLLKKIKKLAKDVYYSGINGDTRNYLLDRLEDIYDIVKERL